jgi:hypothetical protein
MIKKGAAILAFAVVLWGSMIFVSSAIDVSVGNSFYIDVGVGDSLYIDVTVGDFYHELGVDVSDPSGGDTNVTFDKGYIQTHVMEVTPGQRFKGVVKDAGKLKKAGGPSGIKNGTPVEIHCKEKGKFRMTFPDPSSK